MSVFIMLLRKMAKNRWLVACLFVGMLFCIALAASIPMYKDAVLRYMLVKDLERSYETTGDHPGIVSLEVGLRTADPVWQRRIVERFERDWNERVRGDGAFDWMQHFAVRETVRFKLSPSDPSRVDSSRERSAKFAMRTDLERHVRIVDGRLPSDVPVDGAFEAMVTDNALVELDMLLGQEFAIDDPFVGAPIRIVPVAVIEENDLSETYWSRGGIQGERNAFFLNDRLFESELLEDGPIALSKIGATAVADYAAFDLGAGRRLLELKADAASGLLRQFNHLVSTSVWVPGSEAAAAFEEREATLRRLLLSLNVPMLLLLGFYLYMATDMLVERQKGEIAVFRSRGASRLQIVAIHASEFGLLALAAFVAGPWLAALFTKALGSTGSFLNFVDRGSLPVELGAQGWLYAGAAVAAAWLLNLIPVLLASRLSVVDQKRKKSRETGRPAWQTFGADFALLGVSLYGWYVFRGRMKELAALGTGGDALSSDPLLYVMPAFFILGAGLLALRLYPPFVRLVFRLGRRFWSPQQYSTLLLVGRRNREYHGFMAFLLLTIGMGIYNAGAARTINGNMEDRIRYAGGADVVLRQQWVSDAPAAAASAGVAGMAPPVDAPDKISYREPPLEAIERLPGVEHAARVFVRDGAEAWLGNRKLDVRLMGIDTDAFGRVAWMKEGLLPYHFYEYLNVIAPDPNAALVSARAAEELGLKAGDTLEVGWEGIRPARVTIYGFIDYFPAFDPNARPVEEGGTSAAEQPPVLVVAHLEKIQNELALEPYDVWVKLASPGDRIDLVDAIERQGIALERFEDTYGAIEESRTDAFRMAVNGVMSLGYVVSLVVAFIGFLLFWLLSLQGRLLQYGIFRAMGISFRGLLGMLFLEQLLTSGVGMLIGIAAGYAAGKIYVPLFQLTLNPGGEAVPPFEVVSSAADAGTLAASGALMLAAALSLLAWLLKRMNIHQAVKLGEE